MFRSRAVLELGNLALRHQIGLLQRSARKRFKLTPAAATDLARLSEQSPHAAGPHRLLHRAHPPFPGSLRVYGQLRGGARVQD